MRLLRVLKWTRYWVKIDALVLRLLDNIAAILSLLGLLQLLITIFALLGMQLFGGKFDDGTYPNFDDFWHAYLCVFQILTQENWPDVMHNSINAYGGPKSVGLLVSAPVA